MRFVSFAHLVGVWLKKPSLFCQHGAIRPATPTKLELTHFGISERSNS